ncbi:MAG TPA: PHP domain-containing protein [Candidatus Saccharimonadales bacterium]|nr:PHP domain-containing protein [Candidatus Saccharimonadales bacterium]
MTPPFGLPFGRPPRSEHVDLHLHSTCSDGSLSPEELVAQAQRLGLGAIAITDHDTTVGVGRARRAAQAPLEVVAGVELSISEGKSDVHLLLYGCDLDPDGLEQTLKRFREARERRAEEMVARLNGLGVEVTMADVRLLAGHGSIGRPHLAQALVLNGQVETSQQAFERWLGHGRPAWVPKEKLSLEEAAALARTHGGLAALAHPGTLHRDDLLPDLRARGVAGLEVWHSRHGEEATKYYLAMARRFGLVATGGSDYHGARTPNAALGTPPVALSVLHALRAALPG